MTTQQKKIVFYPSLISVKNDRDLFPEYLPIFHVDQLLSFCIIRNVNKYLFSQAPEVTLFQHVFVSQTKSLSIDTGLLHLQGKIQQVIHFANDFLPQFGLYLL